MYIPLLLSLAGCTQPELHNQSDFRWNKIDDDEVEYAQKRCGEYYDDAPCLKIFYKTGDNSYKATCGARNT